MRRRSPRSVGLGARASRAVVDTAEQSSGGSCQHSGMGTTLVLDEGLYDRARAWAKRDGVSLDQWLAAAIDPEDSRRRSSAHNAWLRDDPEIVESLEAQDRIAARSLADRNRGRREPSTRRSAGSRWIPSADARDLRRHVSRSTRRTNGFGVPVVSGDPADSWAAALGEGQFAVTDHVRPCATADFRACRRGIDLDALTETNNLLFTPLATDRAHAARGARGRE